MASLISRLRDPRVKFTHCETQHCIPSKSIQESQKQKQNFIVQYTRKKTSFFEFPNLKILEWRRGAQAPQVARCSGWNDPRLPQPCLLCHAKRSPSTAASTIKIPWPVLRVSIQPARPDFKLTAGYRLWPAFPGSCPFSPA